MLPHSAQVMLGDKSNVSGLGSRTRYRQRGYAVVLANRSGGFPNPLRTFGLGCLLGCRQGVPDSGIRCSHWGGGGTWAKRSWSGAGATDNGNLDASGRVRLQHRQPCLGVNWPGWLRDIGQGDASRPGTLGHPFFVVGGWRQYLALRPALQVQRAGGADGDTQPAADAAGIAHFARVALH